MYESQDMINKAFNPDFISEYLLQSQWSEMIELEKIITELYKKKRKPLSILDIGVGDARIPKHLSGIKEIWGKIGKYIGIDHSKNA